SEQLDFYREYAFVKLTDVLSPDIIEYYSGFITAKVMELKRDKGPMEQRDTYGKAFIQVANLWTRSQVIRQLVLSRRPGGIASELMGTDGVRIYHDQALFKEPGGGFTPWHADQYYWPLSSDRCCTAWIPLQQTPLDMGPLEFSAGSHRMKEGRDLQIGDTSELEISKLLSDGTYEHVVEPFEVGEVSFHAGWLFHRAGPNRTDGIRKAMTMIYMDSEMVLKEPDNSHQAMDRDAWCPGVAAGQVIDSPLNPIVHPA
ncbi:MAG: phytanoyl-CoA dioxygenase family protein, partial [Rhodothermales bacterium]|nr:phytanoyl-CoA dioxygenase family protein [Rhodothermales bacterium]